MARRCAGSRARVDELIPRRQWPCYFADSTDNDTEMRGRFVANRPVLGSERDLETIHAVRQINEIWVTFEPEIHKYHRLKAWATDRKSVV